MPTEYPAKLRIDIPTNRNPDIKLLLASELETLETSNPKQIRTIAEKIFTFDPKDTEESEDTQELLQIFSNNNFSDREKEMGAIILLKAKKRTININAKDKKGRTVLHHACQKGYTKLANKLLSSIKTMLIIEDDDSNKPLDLAIQNNPINFDILSLLKKHGANFKDIKQPREDIKLDLSKYDDQSIGVILPILPIIKNIFPKLESLELPPTLAKLGINLSRILNTPESQRAEGNTHPSPKVQTISCEKSFEPTLYKQI